MGFGMAEGGTNAALLRERRLRTIRDVGAISQISVGLSAILLIIAFYGIVPTPLLAGWASATILLIALRLLIVRASDPDGLDAEQIRTHLDRIIASMMANSIFWSGWAST